MSITSIVPSAVVMLLILICTGCASTADVSSSTIESDTTSAIASDQGRIDQHQTNRVISADEEDRVINGTGDQDTTVTGSRLPRKAVDGPQRVIVIDEEEIRSTGALNVTDVLRRTGNNF
ncbi:MAG: hypothetical protein AAAFM81_05310 [Pseudomonadota bacterium]